MSWLLVGSQLTETEAHSEPPPRPFQNSRLANAGVTWICFRVRCFTLTGLVQREFSVWFFSIYGFHFACHRLWTWPIQIWTQPCWMGGDQNANSLLCVQRDVSYSAHSLAQSSHAATVRPNHTSTNVVVTELSCSLMHSSYCQSTHTINSGGIHIRSATYFFSQVYVQIPRLFHCRQC